VRKRWLLLPPVALVAGIYLFNASWRVPMPEGDGLRLIAHRGVHQTYHREELENDTCTAKRVDPPRHDYLENTIASMEAAFAAGADIVELDVHPTTDGQFAPKEQAKPAPTAWLNLGHWISAMATQPTAVPPSRFAASSLGKCLN
jgi:hypothetical protein